MFGLLSPFSLPELLVILIIALVIFGPGKLPEIGKALGKGINEFKKASRDFNDEPNDEITEPEKNNTAQK